MLGVTHTHPFAPARSGGGKSYRGGPLPHANDERPDNTDQPRPDQPAVSDDEEGKDDDDDVVNPHDDESEDTDSAEETASSNGDVPDANDERRADADGDGSVNPGDESAEASNGDVDVEGVIFEDTDDESYHYDEDDPCAIDAALTDDDSPIPHADQLPAQQFCALDAVTNDVPEDNQPADTITINADSAEETASNGDVHQPVVSDDDDSAHEEEKVDGDGVRDICH